MSHRNLPNIKTVIKTPTPSLTYLRIKVIPKSRKTELVEILNEDIDGAKVKTYKIRLKVAPEKGKANDELIKFLSEMFDVPRVDIQIISGKTDRIKLVKIKSS